MINDKPLRIAFVAANASQNTHWFRDFRRINGDIIRRNYRNYVELQDGTEIVPVISNRDLCGSRFDQVIVADDRRRLLLSENGIIATIINEIMATSSRRIPDEFFIQIYDLDADY